MALMTYTLITLSLPLLQWMPLPVFVVYRIVWFLYILVWLIASLARFAPPDRDGPRWLIYITNQAYLLLVVGSGAITLLTIAYAVVYLVNKSKLQRFYPQPASSPTDVYEQDNIAWFVKICWLLYVMGGSVAIMVVIGYWGFVYDPNCVSVMTANVTINCPVADVYSVHVHLINAVLIVLDLYMSRIPYQLLHIFYPPVFSIVWVIFSLIYFAAGGTNTVDGERYIYEVLDYGNNPGLAAGLDIVLILGPVFGFIILFLLGWLRDVIYKKIHCCFRDFQGSRVDVESEELKRL